MTILDKIMAYKKKEVSRRKTLFPPTYWEKAPLFEKATISLTKALQNSGSGIIAEHKRRSPSKPIINQTISIEKVVLGYEQAAVCGMSILTDNHFFGGSLEDLTTARALSQKPLLRKEFIIEEYQLLEAKAHGADVILLIAACLTRKQIETLSKAAQSLGLEVLLEVHNQEEVEKALMPSLNLLGVNNRNLKTFDVSLDNSLSLAQKIPSDFVKISESGISTTTAIKQLQEVDFQGFLIGEHFMKTQNPGRSAADFIKTIEG